MRILYVCGDIERIGGIEKYNRDFINALRMTDVQLKVVQRFKGGLLAKISFLLHFIFQYFYFRPQVIMCGHLHFAPVCYYLNKIFGTPFTLSLYGIEIISLAGKLKYKTVEAAQQVITISAYSKDLILQKFPHIKSKLFMHPSSVDGDIYFIKQKSLDLVRKYQLQGKKIILSLARLSTPEFKGQDRVLRALPEVLKKIPEAVYVVVGGGKDERIDNYLKENPDIEKNVVFTGPASDNDKVDFYNLADVYILPSKFEGFGIVFIEAASCGIPLIASDGYGCFEGLLNGEIGYVVDPDDIHAIAVKLIEVLNKDEINQMQIRSQLREKTLAVYGIVAWNQRVLELTQQLKRWL